MTAGEGRLGRWLRRAGWLGFAVIVAVGWVAMTSDLAAQWRQVVIDAVTYLLPLVLAFGASIALTIRTQGLERRVWALTALGSALLVCSETYISYYIDFVDWHGPQLPATFELLQAGAALAFIGIISSLVSFDESSMAARVRVVVDILCAVVVGLAVTYWWMTLPLYGGIPRAGWQAAAVTSVYPILGTALLVGGTVMLLRTRRDRRRGWERLLGLALAFYGMAACFEPLWYAQALSAPFPAEGGVLSLLFGFGYYLLFMALVYRLTSGSEGTGIERWPAPQLHPEWLSTVYPSLLACALPLMAWASIAIGHQPQGRFIVWLTGVLGTGLVVRTWLSDFERDRLRGLAITDPISGAYNFRFLHERLAEEIRHASPPGAAAALIVFDIDEFSRTNAVWGHDIGDDLLRRIAGAIASVLEPHSNVYRVGSDEFAVLVFGPVEEAVAFAKRVQARVALTQLLPQGSVTLSAGIAIYPGHGRETEQLLAHAQAAQQLGRLAESGEPVVYDEELVGSVDPVERLARAQRRAHRATVQALASAVDARDADTRNHSENVAELATSLATVLGLPTDQVRLVRLAAQMHDVGKIGIRDSVLLTSEDALTAEERRHVEEHPVLGERILAPAQLVEILPAVRHHHERWDGAGYPDRLRGPQIPVGARILAVCDAFDAMTSVRTFREAMPLSEALDEIERRAGSQFDPEVAATFVRMVTHLRSPVATDDRSPLS